MYSFHLTGSAGRPLLHIINPLSSTPILADEPGQPNLIPSCLLPTIPPSTSIAGIFSVVIIFLLDANRTLPVPTDETCVLIVAAFFIIYHKRSVLRNFNGHRPKSHALVSRLANCMVISLMFIYDCCRLEFDLVLNLNAL